ncbi:MAG: hypothetical protein BWY26_01366 [Elusimicrobia bacterium ADurb.Bin231]|nr:MAG: hypothetical protein BWY26_01366 [Elusimicrobia bacterium ADurb.Bin231]
MDFFNKIIKRIFLEKAILSFLLLFFLLYSFSLYAEVGKSGWSIFNKPQSGRFSSVNLISPLNSDLSFVFYNPALAVTKVQRELFLISEMGISNDTLGGMVYAEPLSGGVACAGIVLYSAGDMDLNWLENGAEYSRNVNALSDTLITLSYGFKYEENAFVGASFKIASEKIADMESASAYVFDFGALYAAREDIFVSVALRNLGFSTAFYEEKNILPASLYAGAGYMYKLMKTYLMPVLGITVNIPDSNAIVDIGVDAGYDLVFLNLGYRINAEESNIHIGAGVKWQDFDLSYSYIPGRYMDASHRLGLSYKFGPTHAYDTYDFLLRKKEYRFMF